MTMTSQRLRFDHQRKLAMLLAGAMVFAPITLASAAGAVAAAVPRAPARSDMTRQRNIASGWKRSKSENLIKRPNTSSA